MYIRLVTKFCSQTETLIAKEAHIDTINLSREGYIQILEDCMKILNEKAPEIKKLTPAHLKNKDFEIIIYGNYLSGFDYYPDKIDHVVDQRWSYRQPIFNVTQLGLPEENRPIIKTA